MWGVVSYGGNSSAVADKIDGSIPVVSLFSTTRSFAALREDGSVITWGKSFGVDTSSVENKINGDIDVVDIIPVSHQGFIARRSDGSQVYWGWGRFLF